MLAVVERNLDEIRALCREYGVLRLELFGSATTGTFVPERSDLDFVVEYPPDYDFGLWLTRYFEFRDRLAALLGRPVDLVMAGAVRKRAFAESVAASRQILYAA
ncbi:MAG TPA: nucleotidyltransferase domain-containing protein [Thermomicrobiaceae bacterium]|nr:nucleotidyltransferase domain-containing protein [Thermomicrobiaceae bacterium]